MASLVDPASPAHAHCAETVRNLDYVVVTGFMLFFGFGLCVMMDLYSNPHYQADRIAASRQGRARRPRGPRRASYPALPRVGEPNVADDTSLREMCTLCMDRYRGTVVVPCGHIYACVTCMAQSRPPNCDLCRTRVERVLQTYTA